MDDESSAEPSIATEEIKVECDVYPEEDETLTDEIPQKESEIHMPDSGNKTDEISDTHFVNVEMNPDCLDSYITEENPLAMVSEADDNSQEVQPKQSCFVPTQLSVQSVELPAERKVYVTPKFTTLKPVQVSENVPVQEIATVSMPAVLVSNNGISLEKLEYDVKLAGVPSNWVISREDDSLEFYFIMNMTVQRAIVVYPDYTYVILVHDKPLFRRNYVYTLINRKILRTPCEVKRAMVIVGKMFVCCGNYEALFITNLSKLNCSGVIESDYVDVDWKGRMYRSTIRSKLCSLLGQGLKRCKNCTCLRDLMKKRLNSVLRVQVGDCGQTTSVKGVLLEEDVDKEEPLPTV